MWPYRYDRALPTPWLWVSEGITDYYASVVMSRGKITSTDYVLRNWTEKASNVAAVPPIALEDASLSTWVHPGDGTGYIYYPKGALAGLLLDVMIRDASDNRRSLDDAMRDLYRSDYKQGRGFTGEEWWAAVRRAAGGRTAIDLNEFYAKYIDGREPFPYDRVFPLAGLRLQVDSQRIARIGVQTMTDSTGQRVMAIVPGGMADKAGIMEGDYLMSFGDVPVKDPNFGSAYREKYGTQPEGTPLPIVVRRNGQPLTLNGAVHFVSLPNTRIVADPTASPKAARIREGILRGTVDR
jgi:predicted metalloprotease with PDZ domain